MTTENTNGEIFQKIDGNNTDHFEINETDTSINIETDVHEKLYKSLYWVKAVRRTLIGVIAL